MSKDFRGAIFLNLWLSWNFVED